MKPLRADTLENARIIAMWCRLGLPIEVKIYDSRDDWGPTHSSSHEERIHGLLALNFSGFEYRIAHASD